MVEPNLVDGSTDRWPGAVIAAFIGTLILLWIDSLIVVLVFAVAANPSWASKAWAVGPILVLVSQVAWVRHTWFRAQVEERSRQRVVLRIALNAILVAFVSVPVAVFALII